jgi:DNA-binding response OmpR family regulator
MPARVLISSSFFPRANAIGAVIREAGLETAVAMTTADSLETCRSGWPDIVLLDGIGPLSEVRECCRALRGGVEAADISVLILTDASDPKQNLFALEAGADECLGYPCDPDILVARIRSLAQWTSLVEEWRSLVPAEDRPELRDRPARNPRGLILDPDDRSRERLTDILSHKAEIFATQDEGQALAQVASGTCEFLLLGLNWPEVRTSRLCQRIRLLDRGRQPRLLLVTHGDGWCARDLEEHGVDDVILRPVDRSEVLGRVRLALRKEALATAVRSWKAPGEGRCGTTVLERRFRAPPNRFAA